MTLRRRNGTLWLVAAAWLVAFDVAFAVSVTSSHHEKRAPASTTATFSTATLPAQPVRLLDGSPLPALRTVPPANAATPAAK